MLSTIIGIILLIIIIFLVVQLNQAEEFRRRGRRGRRGRHWWRRIRFRPRRRRYLGAPIILGGGYPYNYLKWRCLSNAESVKDRCLATTNNDYRCLIDYNRHSRNCDLLY